MNWVDIIGIMIVIGMIIGSVIIEVMAVQDEEYSFAGGFFIVSIALICLAIGIFFGVIDKSSGTTQGIITSVDKNFFGTTAVYIKTSESSQEKYCIENDEIAKVAGENIGKKVTVKYGKRVGLYSTGRCSEGPIEDIKLVENE